VNTPSIRRGLLLTLMLATTAAGADPGPLHDYNIEQHGKLLKQHAGQVVLVNFWATWCAPCREEMPLLVAMEKKLRAEGLRIVTVSADEIEDKAQALEFLTAMGVAAPVYIKNVEDDDAFIESIDPEWSGALPALYLYGRDGKLARSWVGETKMAELEAAIRELL
jgi:thiol-disulfide isomerase/thioredoxin